MSGSMEGVKGRVATMESDTLAWHIGNTQKAHKASGQRWIDASSMLSSPAAPGAGLELSWIAMSYLIGVGRWEGFSLKQHEAMPRFLLSNTSLGAVELKMD